MNCEDARNQFADVLMGGGDAVTTEFHEHVGTCTACRDELDMLRTHWAALGLLEDAEPDPSLRRGFYRSLEAFQEGLTHRQRPWLAWWPKTAALQVALSIALLFAGGAAGYWVSGQNSPQVAELRQEVERLNQVMALSLLQQQSAFTRLEGVAWAYRVERSDSEVLEALLRTADSDPSVDVRLAAVDALRLFSDNASLRPRLAQSLPRQNSPLMQVALIDLLVELRERSAVPQLQRLLKEPALDQTVQKRAQRALYRLE